jgi:hypothetical protein
MVGLRLNRQSECPSNLNHRKKYQGYRRKGKSTVKQWPLPSASTLDLFPHLLQQSDLQLFTLFPPTIASGEINAIKYHSLPPDHHGLLELPPLHTRTHTANHSSRAQRPNPSTPLAHQQAQAPWQEPTQGYRPADPTSHSCHQ